MKKILSLCLVLVLLLSLCACMSDADKAEKRKYEAKGQELIEEYVQSQYGNARVGDAECWTRRYTGGILLSIHPTTYVSAEVKHGGKTFYVMTDVVTGQCWDTFQADRLEEALCQLLGQRLSTQETPAVSLTCLPAGLFIHSIYDAPCKDRRFFSKDATLEEVLSSGNYGIQLTVCYEDLSADLSQVFLGDVLENVCDESYLFVAHSRTNKENYNFQSTVSWQAHNLYRYLRVDHYAQDSAHLANHRYGEYQVKNLGEFSIAWESRTVTMDGTGQITKESTREDVSFTPVEAAPGLETEEATFTPLSGTAYALESDFISTVVHVYAPWTEDAEDGHTVIYSNSLVLDSNDGLYPQFTLSNGDTIGLYKKEFKEE